MREDEEKNDQLMIERWEKMIDERWSEKSLKKTTFFLVFHLISYPLVLYDDQKLILIYPQFIYSLSFNHYHFLPVLTFFVLIFQCLFFFLNQIISHTFNFR